MELVLDELRKQLPKDAEVNLIKYRGKSPAIECRLTPSIHWRKHDEIIQKQEDIIGKENILEFYTEETGHHWYIFLKHNNKPITIEI